MRVVVMGLPPHPWNKAIFGEISNYFGGFIGQDEAMKKRMHFQEAHRKHKSWLG